MNMKKYLYLLISLIVLSGCKYTETTKISQKIAIEIDAQIARTKATPSGVDAAGVWEENDLLGLYLKNASGFEINNVQYKYDGTKFVPATLDALAYDSYQSHDFYGYYPYDANVSGGVNNPVLFSVKADQSAAGGYTLSDLMWTQKLNQVPQKSNDNKVDLEFSHKLVNVRVKLHNYKNEPFNIEQAPVVKLVNTNMNASLNLSTGVASEGVANVGEITLMLAKPFVKGTTVVEYIAVMVPQTVPAGKQLFLIKVGSSTYAMTISADAIFEPNKEYLYTITNRGVDLVIGEGQVLEWGEGAKIVTTADAGGILPCTMNIKFNTVPTTELSSLSYVDLTIDGNEYKSLKATWNADAETLVIVYDQGENWGYNLTKVVLRNAEGTSLKEYSGSFTILGDPTASGYDKVITL